MKNSVFSAMIICACMLISSCSMQTIPTVDNQTQESGSVSLSVNVGAVGMLAKTQAMQLKMLTVALTRFGYDPVDTTIQLTMGINGGTIPIHFDSLAVFSEWKVTATVTDMNDSIIQETAADFIVTPNQTTHINLNLVSRFSILVAKFFPLRDSVRCCKVLVDGTVCDSVLTEGYSAGDMVTVNFNYLPVGSRFIELRATGTLWGTEYTLYSAQTSLAIVPGESKGTNLQLAYTGPSTPPPGQEEMGGTVTGN